MEMPIYVNLDLMNDDDLLCIIFEIGLVKDLRDAGN
jgi:hypothetical protein